MVDHEVGRFVNGVAEKLAAHSRHVCLFLGAGVSRACGLPDIAGLTGYVRASLEGDHRVAFERLIEGRDLEQVLTRLRRIVALLDGGDDTVDGLTPTEAQDLDLRICRLIIEKLDTRDADKAPMLKLGAWAARADYHRAVEVFTVNYDLLVETGLEALGVPYFDGFVGTLRAPFRSDLVEDTSYTSSATLPAFLVRLWKLHGSVHWTWSDGEHPAMIRLGAPVPSHLPAAIYPSDAKYDESRRVPFVVLQDRLRRALGEPETLLFIAGYSFGDQHLNEVIFEAALRHPRSEYVAFCFGPIPVHLASAAMTTPNLQVAGSHEAIIGGLRGNWRSEEELPEDVWQGGEFRLGDFKHLSSFLARSSPPQFALQERLGALLAEAAKTDG